MVPDFDPPKYLAPAEIRAELDRVHKQVLRELPGLDEAELDQPVPHPHPFAKTKLLLLLWCAQHEMIHAGQIGLSAPSASSSADVYVKDRHALNTRSREADEDDRIERIIQIRLIPVMASKKASPACCTIPSRSLVSFPLSGTAINTSPACTID